MRRVAITGFGVVSPVGIGKEAFWSGLEKGESGIDYITRFDCGSYDVRLAAEVKDNPPLPENVAEIASYDPKVGYAYAAFSEAAKQALLERLDEQTLLHLGVSLEILPIERVLSGGRDNLWKITDQQLTESFGPFKIPLDTALDLICEKYGQPSGRMTNCSACAAGAQAIGHGFSAVRSGRYDIAVCGGFDSMINPLGVGGFQLLGALTSENELGASACRPFDSRRSGTVLGEGAAIFILEPLEKATALGKNILAEICGFGSTMDAHSLSAPGPEGEGAARAMRAALEDADIPPEKIALINAHGTGTKLNDEVEATAIRKVFKNCWENIPVNATKSMIGHLIGASGAVEAGACLLALKHNKIHPNVSLDKVAVNCELNHVMKSTIPYNGEYVLSNSFGFGGQNATIVMRSRHGG